MERRSLWKILIKCCNFLSHVFILLRKTPILMYECILMYEVLFVLIHGFMTTGIIHVCTDTILENMIYYLFFIKDV